MLDVDFLRTPSEASRLVYCYRSGRLRLEMARALHGIAKRHGLEVALHKPRAFRAGLSGFFEAMHWCELQGARPAAVEDVLRAFANYTGGPAAIFVKPTIKMLQSEFWSEVTAHATIVEEPEPDEKTLEMIVGYALDRSDLSPPAELASDLGFRSRLLARLPFYRDINDVFQDVDDYILTHDDVSASASKFEARIPEHALVRTLRSFLIAPYAKQERALLDQALLRGDSEPLAIGALTAATIGLLDRSEGDVGPADGQAIDLVLWTIALLASQLGIAILHGGYAPSWRDTPDVRGFAVAQLCRDYRRGRVDRSHRDWLVYVAGEALARVALAGAGDTTAVRRLGERLKALLSAIEPRLVWLDALLASLRGTNVVARSSTIHFGAGWSTISDQRTAVERLRRLIIEGKFDGAILIHGHAAVAKAKVAAAWVQACLCDSPIAGEGCGRCSSCLSLLDGESPFYGIARLGTEPRHDIDESASKAAADDQVNQVRKMITEDGLWPGRRAIILDGVDKVRKGALDRLLKIIEEAPKSVNLVFLADSYHRVPAAIRSRSRASVALKEAVVAQGV